MYELGQEKINTNAGVYTVTFIHDDDVSQPEDEGFTLMMHGYSDCIDVNVGDVDRLVQIALHNHGKGRDDSWPRVWRSGAAVVRYLTLKGHRGVTLVGKDYRPVEATSDRNARVYGVAWAPEDVPERFTRSYVEGRLKEWAAWAEGDVFGYGLTGPDNEPVEDGSHWGFYDFNDSLPWLMPEIRSEAESDAYYRVKQANTVGAGFVGLI